jgi:outer membrane receptor protein involved in Fe transport
MKYVVTRILIGVATIIECHAQQNQQIGPSRLNSAGSALSKGSTVAASSTTAPALMQRPGTVIKSEVIVDAHQEQMNSIDSNGPVPLHATAAEVISSAGTFGDFSRYIQTFPGVAFDTDESDDILVRGGNPIENLFLVDGIEVPNINHITSEASTGGLVSMIDTAALKDVDLHSGAYNASYEERLSSVIDIHTRELSGNAPVTEGDFGFIGAGGTSEMPMNNGGSFLISAHRSLLNLFTDDIGLDGVPIYTDYLASSRLELGPADTLSVLTLGGVDSINITPAAFDDAETSTIQVQYRGWRISNGARWQHVFSPSNFGVLTFSDAEQHEHIGEEDQFFQNGSTIDIPVHTDSQVPVYSELTHDSTINLRYDAFINAGSRMSLVSGGSLHLYGIDYNIAQPQGEQSVLSTNPDRTDADSFAPHFWTKEEGAYAEATWKLSNRLGISAGGRAESYQFGHRYWFTPRSSMAFQMSSHTGLRASFGEYRQLPSFLYMTAWPENFQLRPIRARHVVAGIDLYTGDHNQLSIEAYQKNYSNYPVSKQYPEMSLANLVDTLGQEFLWLPMTSQGRGITKGIEFSTKTRIGSHFVAQANAAWSRAEYSGLDGALRPGNFDYPLVVNFVGDYHPSRRDEITWRYEGSSGRPYTPYLLSASAAQDRPIYDVSQLNALRLPMYSRLDFELNHIFVVQHTKHLAAYAGLDNAFNHKNLLGYFWMPRVGIYDHCAADPEHCMSPQYQMKEFPDFGIRYMF